MRKPTKKGPPVAIPPITVHRAIGKLITWNKQSTSRSLFETDQRKCVMVYYSGVIEVETNEHEEQGNNEQE